MVFGLHFCMVLGLKKKQQPDKIYENLLHGESSFA
jgi:hypothetical protein